MMASLLYHIDTQHVGHTPCIGMNGIHRNWQKFWPIMTFYL